MNKSLQLIVKIHWRNKIANRVMEKKLALSHTRRSDNSTTVGTETLQGKRSTKEHPRKRPEE